FIQDNVREQRAERTSLRSAFLTVHNDSVYQDAGLQILVDELKQALVLDSLRQLPHELVMVHPVKEFLQVDIDYPAVAIFDTAFRFLNRPVGTPIWAEPVTVVRESGVIDRRQHLGNRLLNETINHGRDSKQSHAAVRFRDFDPADRLWLIGSRQKFHFHGVPVFDDMRSQVLYGHFVDTVASFITNHSVQGTY